MADLKLPPHHIARRVAAIADPTISLAAPAFLSSVFLAASLSSLLSVFLAAPILVNLPDVLAPHFLHASLAIVPVAPATSPFEQSVPVAS